MNGASYVGKRLVAMILTIFLALTMNFIIFRAAPGDATATLAKCRNCTARFRETLRSELGLDKSKLEQYGLYLKELSQGNLGTSFVTRRRVWEEIKAPLLRTLPMLLLGELLGVTLGITVGVIGAWRRRTAADWAGTFAALAFYSMPAQWLALMLVVVFAGILPTSGVSDPFLRFADPTWSEVLVDRLRHMILPSLTLALIIFGGWVPIVRSSLLESLSEDYVVTARAKGLKGGAIMRRHAFRNSMLPIVTIGALSLGSIAGGAILVEAVFSYPGVGLELYEAVLQRDYPMLQGTFLIITITVILANFAADLLHFKLDPRIRA